MGSTTVLNTGTTVLNTGTSPRFRMAWNMTRVSVLSDPFIIASTDQRALLYIPGHNHSHWLKAALPEGECG